MILIGGYRKNIGWKSGKKWVKMWKSLSKTLRTPLVWWMLQCNVLENSLFFFPYSIPHAATWNCFIFFLFFIKCIFIILFARLCFRSEQKTGISCGNRLNKHYKLITNIIFLLTIFVYVIFLLQKKRYSNFIFVYFIL